MIGNEKIAITISPPDRTTFLQTTLDVFNQDSVYIESLLHNCSKDFCIYPELDLSGRLHYHGTMTVIDRIKWFKTALPKLKKIGFVKIKPIDDLSKWLDYCQKDWPMTSKLFGVDKPIIWAPAPRFKKISKKAMQDDLENGITYYFEERK